MAGNKYLTLVSGIETMVAATQTSAGAGDAGKIVALNSAGQVDITMMPTGVGPDTKSMITSENLAAGALVNVYSDSGTLKARNADNSNARPCHGFVIAATSSPAVALVYFSGINNQLSGLTIGAREYLGTTGNTTETPVTSGISQYIGIALSATEMQFNPADYIQF